MAIMNVTSVNRYPAFKTASIPAFAGTVPYRNPAAYPEEAGDTFVRFGAARPKRNKRLLPLLLGSLMYVMSGTISGPALAVENPSFDLVSFPNPQAVENSPFELTSLSNPRTDAINIAPDVDPLQELSRGEINRRAAEDDGVRIPQISPLDVSPLAEYQEARTGHIRMRGGGAIDPNAPLTPARFDDKKFNGYMGTAWFSSTDGKMITNHHITEHAEQNPDGSINVRLADGSEYSARILFESPQRDLAYIQLLDEDGEPFEKGTFPSFRFVEDSNNVKKGNYVALTGNHKGYLFTFVDGKISHTQRWRPSEAVPLFQYSIPTDGGSSGSAVTLHTGEVVALHNSGIISKADMNQGIHINDVADAIVAYEAGLPVDNFAIPGFTYDLTPYDSQHNELRLLEQKWYHSRQAVLLAEQELESFRDIRKNAIDSLQDDMEKMELRYQKELEKAQKREEEFREKFETERGYFEKASANVQDLSVKGGVIVTSVEEGGMAEEIGLREGDVITHLDGQEVDPHSFTKGCLRRFVYHNPELTYIRDGQVNRVTVSDETIQAHLIDKRKDKAPDESRPVIANDADASGNRQF